MRKKKPFRFKELTDDPQEPPKQLEIPLCPRCKAYHSLPPLEHLKPGQECDFDPQAPCRLCGLPLEARSIEEGLCPFCCAGYQRVTEEDDESTDG